MREARQHGCAGKACRMLEENPWRLLEAKQSGFTRHGSADMHGMAHARWKAGQMREARQG
jgi:hypothetical protein